MGILINFYLAAKPLGICLEIRKQHQIAESYHFILLMHVNYIIYV
jgi:hypothetical protein